MPKITQYIKCVSQLHNINTLFLYKTCQIMKVQLIKGHTNAEQSPVVPWCSMLWWENCDKQHWDNSHTVF